MFLEETIHVVYWHSSTDLLKNKPYCHPLDDPKCKDDLQPLAITAIMILSYNWVCIIPWLMVSESLLLWIQGVGIRKVTFLHWLRLEKLGSIFDLCRYNHISCYFDTVYFPKTENKCLEGIKQYFNAHWRSWQHISFYCDNK